MRKLISIDPGKKGAIVDFEDGKVAGIHSIPLKAWGNNQIVDAVALMALLDRCINQAPFFPEEPAHVVIEKVGPGPRDGVASAGNFMQNFGILQGVIEPFYATHYVQPQTWKTWAGLRGLVKKMSIARAIQKHPEAKQFIEGFPNTIDRADAVLIGSYYWNIKLKGGKEVSDLQFILRSKNAEIENLRRVHRRSRGGISDE